MDDERLTRLEQRINEMELLTENMGDGLTDTQAHMMAIEVILVAMLDQAKLDRTPIIALFHAMRANVPPEIARRGEEILHGLLGLEPPDASGFH